MTFCGLALMIGLAGLGFRLAFLHLGAPEKVRVEFEDKRRAEKPLVAERGTISDCKGRENILAINMCSEDVCADPSIVLRSNALDRASTVLACTLGVPWGEMRGLLNQPGRQFVCLRRGVTPDKAEAVRNSKLPGIFIKEVPLRYYPQGIFMCHVLGAVNQDGTGCAGIEQTFERYLKGCNGVTERQVDALRRPYGQSDNVIPAVDGADVVLTLDPHIQYMVEKALDEAMIQHRAKGAWAIVQRVRTGEILAMGSRPGFDLNRFRNAGDAVKLNRAVGFLYEPGSTFKPVVISAALNEGVVTPSMVFNTENGVWFYNKRPLRDYHAYASLTVADGVKKSSNILAAKVSLMVGEQRFYRYLKDYGFGRKAGVDLPGEEAGILWPPSKWSSISCTRIAVGQGVAVTAIQMIGMLGAIGNDGCLMRPYVTRHVTRRNGTLLYQATPEIMGRPISARTAAVMRRLLARVTEEGGTGTRARIAGYDVAGKTGTAQKVVDGKYSTTAYWSSFMGFVPAETPEIAMIVVVDEPQPLHTGGAVAAPVFCRIASQAVRYLDIPPVTVEADSEAVVASYRSPAKDADNDTATAENDGPREWIR